MQGKNLKPAGTTKGQYLNTDFEGWKLESIKPTANQDIEIYLNTLQTASVNEWQQGLQK